MAKFRPGVSFSDFLVHDSATRKSKIKSDQQSPLRVGTAIWLLAFFAMAFLVVRLGSLQILQGGRFRVLADENRVKRIVLPAPRGTIYDRNKQILAQDISVVEDRDGNEVEAWVRKYPYGKSAAHVLGYLGEVGEDEVGLLKSNGGKYDIRDRIGRGGIEYEYESLIRGINGGRLVEVDNFGQSARELGKQNPIPGNDLQLTLDASVQQAASDALGGRKGSVIVSNPKTGEILTLTSSPSFNPEDISPALLDLNMPLLDRSIGGIYPPGSVFKMVSAIAAMQEGKVPLNFTYEDTGAINVGSFSYTNWYFTGYGGTEGVIGWERALARSTDTFFYKIGEMTGPELMASWSKKFGLGVKTDIDLPGEVAGLIPDPKWKQAFKNERWFLGNTFHMAIGQGDILTTPIQVNLMTNILAAKGKKCQLHLKKTNKMQECDTVEVDSEIMEKVHEGMLQACATGGTAFPLFDFDPVIACKTGTAEYVLPTGKIGTHAWLTAYAPAEDPTITVTVLLEAGGEGSRDAAPIARKVFVKYFNVEDNFNYSALSGQGE